MENKVIITTISGLVELESAPKNIEVVLKDYDVDSRPFDDVKKDDSGQYVEITLQQDTKPLHLFRAFNKELHGDTINHR